MASKIFGSGSRDTSSVRHFEIRLDSSNLILRGSEHESSSVILKGTLVLCLSDSIRIQSIRMRFTGEKRICWYEQNRTYPVKLEEEFIRHNWEFMNPGKRIGETVAAGNYEWPFELILPGNTPESIEGLPESWVIYRMKAKIERGLLQHNAVARRHVRLIRTLDPSSLELAHEMSVENVWTNKLDYSISTPTKGVIFGTAVRVDFKLIPLLKGLRIGKITTVLNETQELNADAAAPGYHQRRKNSHAVAEDVWTLPEDAESEDIEGAEGYLFSRFLALPKTLRQCMQTVDCMGIKTRHSLMLNIQMHNPDSHVSELHATLPLMIYLSPSMPLDENNNLINQNSLAITAESLTSAPPMYGEHQFDQLYNDVDASGYLTPAGRASGIATPYHSQSANTSTDNLASMDRMASSDFAPNVLQHRLNNLEIVGANRSVRDRSHASTSEVQTPEHQSPEAGRGEDTTQSQSPGSSYFDNSAGSTSRHRHYNPISRRVSEDDPWAAAPQHIEFSPKEMSKVPSYSTALQSRATSMNDTLPNYQAAVNTPVPSPPLPRAPSQAHIPDTRPSESLQRTP